MIRLKKILICCLIASFLFPFELSQTEAASTILSKTVEFFVWQESSVYNINGDQISFHFSNVVIPETPTVKSAIMEISGISYNNSGSQTINVDLKQGTAGAGLGLDYILGGTTKPKPFTIKYDAFQGGTGAMSNIIAAGTYDYTLYFKNTSEGGAVSYSILSAKLILTYNYSSSSVSFLKTNKFFIGQETNNFPSSPLFVSKNFTLTIPEQSPVIESVFIEIGGSVKGSGSGYFQAGIVPQGTGETYSNSYSLDLGAVNANSKFLIRHNAFSEINFTEPGSKNYTLYFKSSDFNIDLWNAKLTVTYKYSEQVGGLPISGYVISSIINTGEIKGAAYNSIMWKGTLNGGKVRLQFATSTLETGPWSFKGPDCSSSTYYEPQPDTPIEIMCATDADHNNKQYFRYKVILCSNDCISSGLNNPEVTGVVVNWAP